MTTQLFLVLRSGERRLLAEYHDLDPNDDLSPDSTLVRFSEMSAEAEAEMAEWDAVLKGKRKRRRED